jgi:ATP-binding cassette, subfamily C, bacterial CydD
MPGAGRPTQRRYRLAGRLVGESLRGAARWYLVAAVSCGIAATGLIVAQAGLLARVLATAASGLGQGALAVTLVGLLVVVFGRAAASFGGEVTALRAAVAVKDGLRSRLLTRALDAGPIWLGRQQSGEIATLATSGLDSLDAYYSRYLPQVLLAVVVPVAVIVSMLSVDWVSGLIVALTLPVIPVFAALIGWRTKAQTRRNWTLLARLSGHFLDVVQGLATLKVFGRAKAQEQIVARVTEEYRASVMASLRVAFLSALVLELAAAVATALVAVEVGLRLLYGHLEYSTALFLLLLTPEAFLPVRNAATAFHASADGTAAATRAFEILDASPSSPPTPEPAHPPTPEPAHPPTPEPASPSHAEPVSPMNARPSGPLKAKCVGPLNPGPASPVVAMPDLRREPIRLDGVTLAYPQRPAPQRPAPQRPAPVISQADLTIWPGDRISLVGRNGAGKTTLLGLFLLFIEPKNGRVLVGDAELSAARANVFWARAWREQIGWLPQQPALFPWSVADNITLGRPGVPREAVEHAAGLAGAAEFIASLPDGYDTQLGERALRLSAGERRKIALARLFLRDARLLLLDEPTAHLDQASATEVESTIDALAVGRTVITVTHKLPASVGGRIVLIEDGRLRELTDPVGGDRDDANGDRLVAR